MKKQNIRHPSFCLIFLDWQAISPTFLQKALTTADLLSNDIYFATVVDYPYSYLSLLHSRNQQQLTELKKQAKQAIDDACCQLKIDKVTRHYEIFTGSNGIHQLNQMCIEKNVSLLFKDLHPPLSFTQQLATFNARQFAKDIQVSTWFIAQPKPVTQGLTCINGEQHDSQHELITHSVVETSFWLAKQLSIEIELCHAITPLTEEWLLDTDLTQNYQTTTQQLQANFDQLVSHLQNHLPIAPRITSIEGEPGYVINQRLQQQAADLVIMGWIPQSHWTHAIHGQLAERFLKQNCYDLIIVK